MLLEGLSCYSDVNLGRVKQVGSSSVCTSIFFFQGFEHIVIGLVVLCLQNKHLSSEFSLHA